MKGLKTLRFGLFAILMIAVSGDYSALYAQKNSGKSFSGGSKPSSSSSSKPSSSSGKSFSGGSSSPKPSPSTPKPSTSGKSFSGGSSSTPSTPPKTTPSGKSFSSGSGSSSSSSNSSKPTSSGWNPGLSSAAKKEESRKAYVAATKPAPTPKPTYRTSTGVEKPLKADSPDVVRVRNYVTHERYVTYNNRASVFYGSYYGHPQPYNDYFSPFLMGMMVNEWTSHQRALWVYHHYEPGNPNGISEERYRELLRKDARLQAELDALRAQNLARDPNYIPPQYEENPDLLYDEDFVKASYNAQEESSSVGAFFFWFFVVVFSIIGVIFLIWLVYCMFVKEYP